MKTLEDKTPKPACEHNGILQYQTIDKGKAYCCLAADMCIYYKSVKNQDLCYKRGK